METLNTNILEPKPVVENLGTLVRIDGKLYLELVDKVNRSKSSIPIKDITLGY